MAACEAYELEMEMERRGALGPEQAEALRRHRSGCAACQRYASLIQQTETLMTTTADAQVGQVDWNALTRSLEGALRRFRMPWDWILRNLLLTGVMALWAFHVRGWPYGSLMVVAGAAATLGLRALHVRTWRRETLRVARNEGEVMALFRRALDQELRNRRRSAWIAPLVFAVFLAQPFLDHQALSTVEFALRCTMAGFVLCASVYDLWIALPKMERERAALQ